MTLSLSLGRFVPARPRDTARSAPKRPDSGPVLIGDCATAADHATLLLALWRQRDLRDED